MLPQLQNSANGLQGNSNLLQGSPYASLQGAPSSGLSVQPAITGSLQGPGAGNYSLAGSAGAAGAGGAGGVNGSGSGSGSGSSTGQSLYQTTLGEVNPLISQLSGLYNQLFGAVDANTTNASNSLKSQYQDQFNTMAGQFDTSARQMAQGYQARGLGDSSYAGDGYNSALGDFQNQSKAGVDAETNQLTTLGGQAASEKAKYAAYPDIFQKQLQSATDYANNNDYTTANYLLKNLESQGLQQLPDIQGQLAQYQPGGSLLSQLNQIAPTFDPSQLTSQLNQLTKSSTPGFAQNGIASGLIGTQTAGQPDQTSSFQNYYNNLLKSSGIGS